MTNNFYEQYEINPEKLRQMVAQYVGTADDGEIFLENSKSEVISFEDGRVKDASFGNYQGFGLRSVAGELVGYAHSSEISQKAIQKAGDSVRLTAQGYQGVQDVAPMKTNRRYYSDNDPTEIIPFKQKLGILQAMDAYARANEPKLKQFSASIIASRQQILIVRPDGSEYWDVRPLFRINASVVMQDGERKESGSYGYGSRMGFEDALTQTQWQVAVNESLRQARVNMESVAAPAGEMVVVLGPGWPGILLHEAVGHGLEGDFNRKNTSVFSGRIGERVASKGVHVIDDGTIDGRRGSLSIDDEGTKTEKTMLIEDGILKGFMYDRQNARLMGTQSTGNCRRENYASCPMPRMTNTIMLGGHHDPQEILKSVKNGIYAVQFGGGQVDITNGKFVFSCTEAYKIVNGRIDAPLKGATLIGSGPEALKFVSMIGNDLALDKGVGTCGKHGQGVPVGVGQPTIKLDKMLVGGTE